MHIGPRIVALWLCTATLVFAQLTDACRTPDPTNFDQVFACLSSDRFSNGRPVFASAAIPTCDDAAHLYRAALQKSGLPFAVASHWMMPSSVMLSRTLEAFTGQPLAWSRCTDYPGVFDPAHMKACLDRFLPAHYGGRKTLSSVNETVRTQGSQTIPNDNVLEVVVAFVQKCKENEDCENVAGLENEIFGGYAASPDTFVRDWWPPLPGIPVAARRLRHCPRSGQFGILPCDRR